MMCTLTLTSMVEKGGLALVEIIGLCYLLKTKIMISSSPYQVQSSDISRKSSVQSNTTPRKKSGLDNVVVCKDLPTKHTHIASAIETHELPSTTVGWMKDIELQHPAILYSSQETATAKSQQADLWAAKQYRISPNAKLLVRGTIVNIHHTLITE